MTDFNDFELPDELKMQESHDVIDDQLVEATQRMAVEKERLLALALLRGYDGVDIILEGTFLSRKDDFKLGFKHEAWENEPPARDNFRANVQTYDFRGLTDQEKRELLARVGVCDLGEINDD